MRGARPKGALHSMLAHRLGVEILKGTYPPGTPLPTEMDSAHNWKISRSAYREAVRILSAKGLVQSRTKAGTLVTKRSKWNVLDPDVLRWMFEAGPTDQFIQALYELRQITEPAAAALAAQRRQPNHLKAMERALGIMADRPLASPEWRMADLDFHEALLEATGNEALEALTSSIGAAVDWSTQFKQRKGGLQRDPVPDHRAVFEAIARQNVSDAQWFMESLVRQALRDTQHSMLVESALDDQKNDTQFVDLKSWRVSEIGGVSSAVISDG